MFNFIPVSCYYFTFCMHLGLGSETKYTQTE